MPPKSALCHVLTCILLAPGLHAQSAGNPIIRNIPVRYTADLAQLESDGVQAFLATHNLASTDAARLYQYGRTHMLENMIATSPAARTTHQQNVYNWFESLVYQNEVAEDQASVAEHTLFKANPCEYALDPSVAKVPAARNNQKNETTPGSGL